MPDDYIGLISGTSMDGIDAVLATIADDAFELRETHVHAYPAELRDALRSLNMKPDACGLDRLGALDRWVGEYERFVVTKKTSTDLQIWTKLYLQQTEDWHRNAS